MLLACTPYWAHPPTASQKKQEECQLYTKEILANGRLIKKTLYDAKKFCLPYRREILEYDALGNLLKHTIERKQDNRWVRQIQRQPKSQIDPRCTLDTTELSDLLKGIAIVTREKGARFGFFGSEPTSEDTAGGSYNLMVSSYAQLADQGGGLHYSITVTFVDKKPFKIEIQSQRLGPDGMPDGFDESEDYFFRDINLDGIQPDTGDLTRWPPNSAKREISGKTENCEEFDKANKEFAHHLQRIHRELNPEK